mmetsp:Transcript_81280/g.122136  ORF Transcript_81280/g.122136 Transcript_81280/m.122136 type:complete len:112 (+) Transcript_81280:351-686(+)
MVVVVAGGVLAVSRTFRVAFARPMGRRIGGHHACRIRVGKALEVEHFDYNIEAGAFIRVLIVWMASTSQISFYLILQTLMTSKLNNNTPKKQKRQGRSMELERVWRGLSRR